MHLKRLWLSHGPSLPQINLLRLQLHTSNPNKIITNPFVSHHHRCRPRHHGLFAIAFTGIQWRNLSRPIKTHKRISPTCESLHCTQTWTLLTSQRHL
ncbi:hypothetical protein HanRHA438_Chr12g0549671 [Helianthus annuus]|nr:hypothetical protein HanRHA438_Chr12g0549671 [Helianthus annuus]